MDRPPERVLQALPDPDRVATMYGELGNKLVCADNSSAVMGWTFIQLTNATAHQHTK